MAPVSELLMLDPFLHSCEVSPGEFFHKIAKTSDPVPGLGRYTYGGPSRPARTPHPTEATDEHRSPVGEGDRRVPG